MSQKHAEVVAGTRLVLIGVTVAILALFISQRPAERYKKVALELAHSVESGSDEERKASLAASDEARSKQDTAELLHIVRAAVLDGGKISADPDLHLPRLSDSKSLDGLTIEQSVALLSVPKITWTLAPEQTARVLAAQIWDQEAHLSELRVRPLGERAQSIVEGMLSKGGSLLELRRSSRMQVEESTQLGLRLASATARCLEAKRSDPKFAPGRELPFLSEPTQRECGALQTLSTAKAAMDRKLKAAQARLDDALRSWDQDVARATNEVSQLTAGTGEPAYFWGTVKFAPAGQLGPRDAVVLGRAVRLATKESAGEIFASVSLGADGLPFPQARASDVWNDLKDKTPPAASAWLAERMLQQQRRVPLVGIDVEERELIVVGPLILIALLFYLFAHLREDPERQERIGLVRSWPSVVITVATIGAGPILVAVLLMLDAWDIPGARTFGVLTTGCVGVMAGVALREALRVEKPTQSVAEKHEAFSRALLAASKDGMGNGSETVDAQATLFTGIRRLLATAVPDQLAKSRLLWIDASPERSLNERRALQALGAELFVVRDVQGAIDNLEGDQRSFELVVFKPNEFSEADARANVSGALDELFGARGPHLLPPLVVYAKPTTPKDRQSAMDHGAYDRTSSPMVLVEVLAHAARHA